MRTLATMRAYASGARNSSARKAVKKEREGFAFTVVEDDDKNVTIEVSREDYERELAAGVDKDSLIKPGRYKMKRGGFLARHPELKIKE